MNAESEIDRLLKEDGATLLRKRKHIVYRLSNGSNFIMASTPGDKRARQIELSRLRNSLGLVSHEAKEGERREKKIKAPTPQIREKFEPKMNGLADKLSLTRVVESRLRDEITMQEYTIEILQEEIDELNRELETERVRECECRSCRFWRWTKKIARSFSGPV